MSSRNAVVVIAVLVVLGVSYAIWQRPDTPKPAAQILDEPILWEHLGGEPGTARRFAGLVDKKISFAVAKDLGIDTSHEAAIAYIQAVAPEMDIQQQKRDQQTASRVADALEGVFLEGGTPESVYEEQNLADIMTEARWQDLVASSSPDHIPTLRRFADSATPVNEPELKEEVVALYLSRSLRDKVCFLPEQYGRIRERLLEKAGYDQTDPILTNTSVFEAECEVEFANFITARLDESVTVYRDELRNYRDYLLILKQSSFVEQE